MSVLHLRYSFFKAWIKGQWLHVREYGYVIWARSFTRKIHGVIALWLLQWLGCNPVVFGGLGKAFKLIGFQAGWDKFIISLKNISSNTVVLSRLVNLSYQHWSHDFDSPTPETLSKMCLCEANRSPTTIIVFFDKSSESNSRDFALSLIASVGYPWQAVFIFSEDCNTQNTIETIVAVTKGDSRIRFDVQELADTESFILIEGNVVLRPHALCILIDALNDSPTAMLVYADEDMLSNEGIPCDPWFKPEFSRFLSCQGLLLGKLIGVRSKLSDLSWVVLNLTVGENSFGELAHGLALMAGEERVLHIPHVLVHNVESSKYPFSDTDPESVVETDVTIIIPTRDRWDLLGNCLDSLWKSDWRKERLRVIVVDNGSNDAQTLVMLKKLEGEGKIEVLRDANEFNWSRLNNIAAYQTNSEVLIFLNNDIVVLDPSWIRKLASTALIPEVGAVGCKLLYPDYTVQHAGVILGPRGGAVHAHINLPANSGGCHDLANLSHEVSAVTGACLAVSRHKYNQVGGFNEDFRVAFNDIDFCLRLHKHGYRNIYLADSLLIHHECKTRGHDDTPKKLILQRDEARRIWLLHQDIMRNDPFYSPNLSFWKPYELAFLPRHPKYWRRYENRPVKVMLLSNTHVAGDNKTVVAAMYAQALQHGGYEVVLAGPRTKKDFEYPGCKTYLAYDHLRAAFLAAELYVDIFIVLSSSFYSIAKWTGAYPVVISIDFGDPPPEMFSDVMRRRSYFSEKELSLAIANSVYAVSESVAKASQAPIRGLLPIANSHMQPWSKASYQHRNDVRFRHGWKDKMVVITTLYALHENPYAKGIDNVYQLSKRMQCQYSKVFERMVFVLYVEGGIMDVWTHKLSGFCVISNLDHHDIYKLFCAADVYLNLSRWDGMDWGLLQARAVGLPALVSNIEAHHDMGAELVEDDQQAVDWLVHAMDKLNPHDRKPDILSWRKTQEKLLAAVESASSFLE